MLFFTYTPTTKSNLSRSHLTQRFSTTSVFQPSDSETFPLRPTPRYCQSSTQILSSNHCIHKGSAKSLTRIDSLFIRTSHEKKILPDVPSPSRVTSYPRSASLRLLSRDSRAHLAACHPKTRPLFNSASSSPLLSAVLLQLLSSSLPPKKRQGKTPSSNIVIKRCSWPQASSLRPARIADSPPKDTPGCVASYT